MNDPFVDKLKWEGSQVCLCGEEEAGVGGGGEEGRKKRGGHDVYAR